MVEIVGIGANVRDTLIGIDEYPKEDTKRKASIVTESGGGPVATGLVAASKLGVSCAYLGALADDAGGRFLLADYEKYGVSNEYIDIQEGKISFQSYILLNRKTGSRTCVYHRGTVAFSSLTEKQIGAIQQAKILMVDGNDLSCAIQGAKIAKDAGTLVLYDAGGLYEGVEELLPLVDILIPSEEFAIGITGCDTAKDAAIELFHKYSPKVVVITQGKRGGILYDGSDFFEYPILPVEVVDSNGSGDVFHGAYAFAICKGYDYKKACVFSSAVSAIKCTGMGARESVPGFEETILILKESGFHEFEEDME